MAGKPAPETNGISKLSLLRSHTVKLLPSQIGGTGSTPLPYTGDPLKLVWSDILLLFSPAVIRLLPVLLYPFSKAPGDETYPELGNFVSLFWQIVLTVYQVLFLCSLPFCLALPFAWFIVYIVAGIGVCVPIWWIVNGFARELRSQARLASDFKHPDEYWVFINGVSVGKHWLQSNIDRLSSIFGRPITGIHNPTNGLIFDLIQCMVERNFLYSTQDIRDAYASVKEALLDEQRKKIILILHSQGGLQGGLMIDWLLAELPDDILRKLEVYTFGNAANHFNNPHRSYSAMKQNESDKASGEPKARDKAIRYIEHYVNDEDMVSNWGVLHFTHISNRFMGRLFERKGTGHLLNQHYLNYMFPLGPDGRALESNEFMETEVDLAHDELDGDREGLAASLSDLLDDPDEEAAVVNDMNSPLEPVTTTNSLSNSRSSFASRQLPPVLKVKDFSRLWQYRNGRSPRD